jgi:mycofactocin system glycosyltransferase
VAPDRQLRRQDGAFVGGNPLRLLRFSAYGETLAEALLTGRPVTTAQEGFVARQLLEAGHAHPLADGAPELTVTAVVPVRDRPDALARCLEALAVATIVVDDGSREPAVLQRICDRPNVTLLRRERSGGPAAARNHALAAADADAILFVDSDVVVAPRTVDLLVAHLADPDVVAVAPRVRPAIVGDTILGRHLAVRSPLDLGPDPARVRPGGPVGYVPTACLLVRTTALLPFAEELRYGEDVDVIWRLTDAGGVVRYDPSLVAHHTEPQRWAGALGRRYRYGTSAGPLARRHPGGRLAPYRAAPIPALGSAAIALAPFPVAAPLVGLVTVATAVRLRRAKLPVRQAVSYAGRSVLHSSTALGRYATAVGLPAAALVLAAPGRRRRRALRLAALAVSSQFLDRRGRPALDPVSATFAAGVDDAAYAVGVWRGAISSRTTQPLLPRLR